MLQRRSRENPFSTRLGVKIIDCKQGSPEWLRARIGRPTASEFDELLTGEWKVRTGQGVETYLYRKLAEKVLGFPLHDASSWAMEQGSIMENEAIPFYEGVYGQDIRRVGFCTTDDGRIGCSPDGLIGDHNGIEIKCPQPQTHLRYLLEGVVPKEYLAQVHGAMFVTGAPKWTFMSYSRQFPPLVLTVKKDNAIQDTLMKALSNFLHRFDEKYAQVKAMKADFNAQRQAEYEANPAAQSL